jgi:hypothetical protein
LLGSYILILVRRQGGSPIEAPKVAMMQAIDPVTGLPVPPGLVRFRVHRSLHLPGEDSTEARWTIQSPSPATLRLSFRGKSIEAPMVRYGQGNGDFQNEVTVLVRRTPKGTMVVARFSEGADRAEIVEHMPGDPKELLKGFVEDLAMTSKAPLGLALLGDGAVAIEALEPVPAGGAPVTAQVVPAGPVRCQVKRTLMVPDAGGLELRWKIDASMPTTLRLSYKDKSVKKALVGHGIGDFRAEISIFFRPAGNGMVMAAGFKDGPDTAQIAEMLPGDPKELLAEAARVVSPDLALPVNTPVWLAFLDKSQVLLEALEPDPDEAKRPQETAAAIVREIELKAAKQRLEHVLRQLAEARMEFATARSQDPSLEEKGLQMRIELLLRESDELRLLIQKLAEDP